MLQLTHINCVGKLMVGILKKCYDWVKGTLDEWKLNPQEQSVLLGPITAENVNIDGRTKAGRLIKSRLDAIYEIKRSLNLLYGNDDLDTQAIWLRTPIDPLNRKSPLEFIKDGDEDAVRILARTMEGP